jgi:hypothetical protein
MKFIKLLTVGATLLIASHVNAATVLTATDGDVNFLFSPINGYDLYMFDDDAFGSIENLLVPLPSVVGIAGPQTDSIGTYHLASNINGSLRLDGASPDFVVGITNDGGATWIMDSNPVFYGNGNAVSLSFVLDQGAGQVLVVDVIQSVPVPATVWLFGSGLIGLVGIARRRA